VADTACRNPAAEIRSANRRLAGHYRRLRVAVEDLCKTLERGDVAAAEASIERIEELEDKVGEALGTLGVTAGALVAEAREAKGPWIIPLGAEAIQADAENHDALREPRGERAEGSPPRP